jgi:alcohol dehydrogenase
MKALVYNGPGKRAWEDKPRPVVENPTDAVLKIARTTICATDLHILKGGVPSVAVGRTLGHEGVGVVEQVGSVVSGFKVGDRALISSVTSCGTCGPCREGMSSRCGMGGGWILGNRIDGTHAEYVRIPFAETSLHLVPKGSDEDALLMLSDISHAGLESGVLKGLVKPGDTVAIVGAGPVGLAVLLTTQLYSPAEVILVDFDDDRLQLAKALGATRVVNGKDGMVTQVVRRLTEGRGVDVAVEAVGISVTLEMCRAMVVDGGLVANVRARGMGVELKPDDLRAEGFASSARAKDTVGVPMLLESFAAGRLRPENLITHEFRFEELEQAYDTFAGAAMEKAPRVIVRAN